MKTGSRGFTLIELLVVIAIIGILAAIVMFSLDEAREKSRDSKRAQEIRQVQKALELYAADHSGSYPAEGAATVYSLSDLEADLVPTYIAAMPVDPDFTGTSGYRYRTKAPTDLTSYTIALRLEKYEGLSGNLRFCSVKNPPGPDSGTGYTGYLSYNTYQDCEF